MFMGPWDQGGPWSPTGIGGVHRFLNRVWTLALDPHGLEPGDAGRRPAAGRRGLRAAEQRASEPRPTGRCASSTRSTRNSGSTRWSRTSWSWRTRSCATAAPRSPAARRGTRRSGCCCSCSRPPRRTSPRSCGAAGWRRQAATWSSIHVERWPEVDPQRRRGRDARGAGPGQRQGPRPGDRARSASATSSSSRSCSPASASVGARPAGRPVASSIAGGGRLVNIVV